MMSSLARPMVWDCLIVGLLFIIGITLAKSTMATIAYSGIILLFDGNHGNQVVFIYITFEPFGGFG
jgi:hypothetical protein